MGESIEDWKEANSEDHNTYVKPSRYQSGIVRLAPDSNWSIKVRDQYGKGQRWVLQASATPFCSPKSGRRLRGHLTYVDATGSERPLTAQSASVAVTLVNHQTTSDDEVVDIVADWQAPTKRHPRGRGLFLDVYGDAVQDDYAGEIQWLLTDVPSTI